MILENNPTKAKHRLSLLLFILLGIIVFLIASPFFFFFGILGQFSLTFLNIFYFVLRSAISIYISLSGISFDLLDLEELNKLKGQKVVLMANHRSHLDMFIFLANVFSLRAAANSYIFRVPVLGLIMRLSKHFEMEKGDVEKLEKAKLEISSAIKYKHRVLFFPEMTRCPLNFQGIQKFRLIPFQLARDEGVKIVPIVLYGTDKVWPRGTSAMFTENKLKVKALKPIDTSEFRTSMELSKYTKRVMEESLMELQK
ncbi:hypothetical protein A9Q84_01220 [Halobacteriovorax marinus]|uniref:Phospholipid/glycerol acyltransferase domain-containing protein n=1 Tax=Halobacteriovorax marinus TaxID=97084 RepID=A0A1Y5FC15_9BACT|nr:hypothetical protein A9Q84_01220 [Halobacteriovorax marinus]